MANTKDLRKRIKSITNTAKITHAMELVAAAKMKRAQDQATAGKPYSDLVNRILRPIANRINPELHPLLARASGNTGAIIFFSTDRGLTGALNTNLIREAANFAGNLKFVTIGKKAKNYAIKGSLELVADFPLSEKPI